MACILVYIATCEKMMKMHRTFFQTDKPFHMYKNESRGRTSYGGSRERGVYVYDKKDKKKHLDDLELWLIREVYVFNPKHIPVRFILQKCHLPDFHSHQVFTELMKKNRKQEVIVNMYIQIFYKKD